MRFLDSEREKLIEELDRQVDAGEITEGEAGRELLWFDNQPNAEM